MLRVLQTAPPHREYNKRRDFSGSGAIKQCSEGLGEARMDMTLGGRTGREGAGISGRENSSSRGRQAIIYSLLGVF